MNNERTRVRTAAACLEGKNAIHYIIRPDDRPTRFGVYIPDARSFSDRLHLKFVKWSASAKVQTYTTMSLTFTDYQLSVYCEKHVKNRLLTTYAVNLVQALQTECSYTGLCV